MKTLFWIILLLISVIGCAPGEKESEKKTAAPKASAG